MNSTKLLLTICLIFMLTLITLPSVFSLGEEQILEIENALKSANDDMKSLIEEGLKTTRYGDTLMLAEQIYKSQRDSERLGETPDYSLVYDKIEELNKIKGNAFTTMDELKALELTIDEIADVDMTSVIEIYENAKREFESERYEKSLELIEDAYKKISELEAIETRVVAFYEATTRNMGEFLESTWEEIIIGIFVAIIAVIIMRKPITKKIINEKIKKLESKRKTLKNLVSKTQKEYFDKGSIGESNYHIRIKKYSEMIRDINRQIPLLKEELAMERSFFLKNKNQKEGRE